MTDKAGARILVSQRWLIDHNYEHVHTASDGTHIYQHPRTRDVRELRSDGSLFDPDTQLRVVRSGPDVDTSGISRRGQESPKGDAGNGSSYFIGCAAYLGLSAGAGVMILFLTDGTDQSDILVFATGIGVSIVVFFLTLSWLAREDEDERAHRVNTGNTSSAPSPVNVSPKTASPAPKVASRGSQYQKYLQSPEWQSTRKQAIARAGYRCQLCGAYASQLEVHHNTYKNLGNERPADIIVLCHDCHSRFHAGGRMPNRH